MCNQKICCVHVLRHGLVRTPETEIVRCHGAMPRRHKNGNHPTVKITPGGLAVQAQENMFRIARAGIHVVQAKALEALQVFDVRSFAFGASSAPAVSGISIRRRRRPGGRDVRDWSGRGRDPKRFRAAWREVRGGCGYRRRVARRCGGGKR